MLQMTTTINITYTKVTIHLSHVQHLFIVITKMLIESQSFDWALTIYQLKQADGAEHRETYGCLNRVMFWAMKNILYTPVVVYFAMTCNFTISR